MKIGIDARLWNETGVGRYIRNLVEQLQELDSKNEYVLFLQSKDAREFKVQSSKFKVVETDIRWHSVAEQIKFSQVLDKENLDLVHFPYFSHPVFYNKPFVVTIHDLIINHFPTGKASTLPYPIYLLKRVGYDFVMQHAINNAAKIIVPLNSVKEDVIETFKISENKIVVTYEGVDISSLRATAKQSHGDRHALRARDDDGRYFLYVGNAYPHKNLDFLIDAFGEFRKETKDEVRLVLVGKDDFFYKKLRKKVEEKKLENIVFKHNVGDEELFTLYSNAHAFVSASKMEGFGLPPLEAMSSESLVLLSDIPAFREVCGEAAIYFDQNSKNSLKEQLGFVYSLDHKTKDRYVQKGLARVKDFSWKKMAEETLNIYNNPISK